VERRPRKRGKKMREMREEKNETGNRWERVV
jgi:hypothetical protein